MPNLTNIETGGDSLFGRYHYYRLHPLSLPELHFKDFDSLFEFWGVPEPFLKKDARFHRRWLRERKSRVLKQDLYDLSLIKDRSMIELLIDLLPPRVGSLLSIKSLQEDLQVSPNTVTAWIQNLENIFYVFRILPFGTKKKIRAIQKKNKIYLWDWSELKDPGARFENLVASHLLKFCHFIEDTECYEVELQYLRDSQGREIDFIVLKDKKLFLQLSVNYPMKKIRPISSFLASDLKFQNFIKFTLEVRITK